MDRKSVTIKKLEKFRREISKDIKVEKMIFFGSRAKGKYTRHSDVDLLLVSPSFKGVKWFRRPVILYRKWNLNYPKDFLCYTPQEFKKIKKLSIVVSEAVKEGIEI